ncbi:hypothetical protein SCLARK_00933 [Spiroplasma clarkii]|uniref:Uncharacterized protein n=1 Tax=Spiroplasma clarkii TaxID=2139 RepID=A0A1Y0L0N2_9MOLU|nr:hypothetical protein [Spiroplasma clarkii]ARU91541.1 hypothetical protein SCLARK_00933 [Spiroplasma clarkii]ATX70947.1 hypothetical protein SCLAR_v1c06280 [Spiroplasma clarkii]
MQKEEVIMALNIFEQDFFNYGRSYLLNDGKTNLIDKFKDLVEATVKILTNKLTNSLATKQFEATKFIHAVANELDLKAKHLHEKQQQLRAMDINQYLQGQIVLCFNEYLGNHFVNKVKLKEILSFI